MSSYDELSARTKFGKSANIQSHLRFATDDSWERASRGDNRLASAGIVRKSSYSYMSQDLKRFMRAQVKNPEISKRELADVAERVPLIE